MLYEHQQALERRRPARVRASELGLDVERFERELAEHVHAARVREDFMSGVRSGVNGTPTFFINGVTVRRLLRSQDIARHPGGGRVKVTQPEGRSSADAGRWSSLLRVVVPSAAGRSS